MKITVPESISLWNGKTVPELPRLPDGVELVQADATMPANYTRLHLGVWVDQCGVEYCLPLCNKSSGYGQISELFGGVFHGKPMTYNVCDACLKLVEGMIKAEGGTNEPQR